MQSVPTKPEKTKLPKCAICKCQLDNVFTGIHVITNGAKQQTVCGICSVYASTYGWKEVLRAR